MLLKELTELYGVSGNEKEVREFIKSKAEKYSDETNTFPLSSKNLYIPYSSIIDADLET